jgi:hypothetical protein
LCDQSPAAHSPRPRRHASSAGHRIANTDLTDPNFAQTAHDASLPTVVRRPPTAYLRWFRSAPPTARSERLLASRSHPNRVSSDTWHRGAGPVTFHYKTFLRGPPRGLAAVVVSAEAIGDAIARTAMWGGRRRRGRPRGRRRKACAHTR